jgi:DNA-binding MarR family transcriptional regulator
MCQTVFVDELDEAVAMARAVKQVRGALIEALRSALHEDGPALRAAHTQVFESLDPEGTRLTKLAERAQMSHQAMGEMIDELIQLGYLERLPDPADARARLIRPSERGRVVLARAAGQLRLLHDRWERELDGLTVAQVVAALDTLIGICAEITDDVPSGLRSASS